MLQIAQTEKTVRPSRRSTTAIARAFAKLDAVCVEWSVLCIDGDEKRFEALQTQGWDMACDIIRMPAQNQSDILLKIAAAGFLMDRKSDKEPLATWQFKPAGYFCDDAGGILAMSIRDDLNRMMEGA